MARRSMREAIVGAAVEQFHSRGFNAAGVKDITDAAGVPKGSFYNHFASKEALAVVALERYGTTRRIAELRDESVDPLVRLRAHFEFLRDEQVDFGFSHGCLVGDFATEIADHSDIIRAAVLQGFENWGDALAAAVAQAQETGQVAAGLDARELAKFMLDAWEGTLLSARTARSAKAFTSFFDIVFGVLLR